MQNTPLSLIGSILSLPCSDLSCVAGYQIDSRKVRPGDLFFAIRGKKQDGHAFLSQAREKGAVGAVVCKDYTGDNFGLSLLYVEDVGEALRFLAKELLALHPVFVVAVTGSVGKTTTKDFIATLLSAKYLVGKTEGSQNSKLTLPLTLLNRTGKEEVFVLEMGASEVGDISRLVEIAPPDIAVITKIGFAHIANYPNGLADIAKEKGMIFSHPKTRLAIFDASFPLEVCPCAIQFHPDDAKELRPFFPFAMPHLWNNFVAAYHVACHLKLSPEEIALQMKHLKLSNMRCEQIEKDGVFYLFDAYNASPDSMQAALQALLQMRARGKKIAVLGSMKELGSFSEEEHRKIGALAKEIVDHLLTLGVETHPLCEAFGVNAHFFTTHAAIAAFLKTIVQKGDVVLIKGSRSMEMEKVLLEMDSSRDQSCCFGC